MKRSELKDPRNWLQKFSDQMYGAPEYTFFLSREELDRALKGLNSVEDKNWRIKTLIEKIEDTLELPQNVDGKEFFILERIDTSEVYLMRNFIELTEEKLYSKTTQGIGVTTTERYK